jgi:hypothetical protein
MISSKKIDRLIELAYYRTCSGVVINVMDIGKVFTEGRRAYAAGENLDAAVAAFVATIRKNPATDDLAMTYQAEVL